MEADGTALRERNAITDFTICIFYIEYYTGKNDGNISEDDYLEVTKLQNLYGYIWRVQNELGVYDTGKTLKENGITCLKNIAPQDYIAKLEEIAKNYHVALCETNCHCHESGMTLTAKFLIHYFQTEFLNKGIQTPPIITDEMLNKKNCNFLLMEE